MGCTLITGREEPWIWEVWAKFAADVEWAAVKPLLMQVMWIEVVHDDLARTILEHPLI